MQEVQPMEVEEEVQQVQIQAEGVPIMLPRPTRFTRSRGERVVEESRPAAH